jgi:hypothetical protein
MHPETRGGWPAFVFIELPRLGVPHPCVLWGNPEADGTIPIFQVLPQVWCKLVLLLTCQDGQI